MSTASAISPTGITTMYLVYLSFRGLQPANGKADTLYQPLLAVYALMPPWTGWRHLVFTKGGLHSSAIPQKGGCLRVESRCVQATPDPCTHAATGHGVAAGETEHHLPSQCAA